VGSTIAKSADLAGYRWHSAEPTCAHAYLWPAVRRLLADGIAQGRAKRVFDLGCGNGATARALAAEGWEVAGIDPSQEGVAYARTDDLDLRVGSAYEDLATEFGRWPFVLCLEVVEHVYFPHRLARTLFELCEAGALAIVTTPYHGYWKNLALSLVPGAWDRHHHPLSDHGHIKFWSMPTLNALLLHAGFAAVRFRRVGRLPAFAKSMIAVAERRDADASAAGAPARACAPGR
jgi:2-polyprenyl-6-hydroxyphenyl methylase/3-demethylubiquinone-9 3-methyltransferase